MKFFLVLPFLLLLLHNSKESTLSLKRPIRGLNTTLQTNFNGTYQRKNPCTNADIETSSYVASHEFHHHTKEDNWSGYTHKCSAIISSFLQGIGRLVQFNSKQNGTFNFHINTSISQKQDGLHDEKQCDSLPTIFIEATGCESPNSCKKFPEGQNIREQVADQENKCLSRPGVSPIKETKENSAKIISKTLTSLKQVENKILNLENYLTTMIKEEPALTLLQDQALNDRLNAKENLQEHRKLSPINNVSTNKNFVPFPEYPTSSAQPGIGETSDYTPGFFNDYPQNIQATENSKYLEPSSSMRDCITSVTILPEDEYAATYSDEKTDSDFETSFHKEDQRDTIDLENFKNLPPTETRAFREGNAEENSNPETENFSYNPSQDWETVPQQPFVNDENLADNQYQPTRVSEEQILGDEIPDFQANKAFPKLQPSFIPPVVSTFEGEPSPVIKTFKNKQPSPLDVEKLGEPVIRQPHNYDETISPSERFQPAELPDFKTTSNTKISDLNEDRQFVSGEDKFALQQRKQSAQDADDQYEETLPENIDSLKLEKPFLLDTTETEGLPTYPKQSTSSYPFQTPELEDYDEPIPRPLDGENFFPKPTPIPPVAPQYPAQPDTSFTNQPNEFEEYGEPVPKPIDGDNFFPKPTPIPPVAQYPAQPDTSFTDQPNEFEEYGEPVPKPIDGDNFFPKPTPIPPVAPQYPAQPDTSYTDQPNEFEEYGEPIPKPIDGENFFPKPTPFPPVAPQYPAQPETSFTDQPNEFEEYGEPVPKPIDGDNFFPKPTPIPPVAPQYPAQPETSFTDQPNEFEEYGEPIPRPLDGENFFPKSTPIPPVAAQYPAQPEASYTDQPNEFEEYGEPIPKPLDEGNFFPKPTQIPPVAPQYPVQPETSFTNRPNESEEYDEPIPRPLDEGNFFPKPIPILPVAQYPTPPEASYTDRPNDFEEYGEPIPKPILPISDYSDQLPIKSLPFSKVSPNQPTNPEASFAPESDLEAEISYPDNYYDQATTDSSRILEENDKPLPSAERPIEFFNKQPFSHSNTELLSDNTKTSNIDLSLNKYSDAPVISSFDLTTPSYDDPEDLTSFQSETEQQSTDFRVSPKPDSYTKKTTGSKFDSNLRSEFFDGRMESEFTDKLPLQFSPTTPSLEDVYPNNFQSKPSSNVDPFFMQPNQRPNLKTPFDDSETMLPRDSVLPKSKQDTVAYTEQSFPEVGPNRNLDLRGPAPALNSEAITSGRYETHKDSSFNQKEQNVLNSETEQISSTSDEKVFNKNLPRPPYTSRNDRFLEAPPFFNEETTPDYEFSEYPEQASSNNLKKSLKFSESTAQKSNAQPKKLEHPINYPEYDFHPAGNPSTFSNLPTFNGPRAHSAGFEPVTSSKASSQAANLGPITFSKASSQSSVIDPVTHSNASSQSSATEAIVHPNSSSQASNIGPIAISNASSQSSVVDPVTHSNASSQSSATEAIIDPNSSSQASIIGPIAISKSSSQSSVVDPITHSNASSQSSATEAIIHPNSSSQASNIGPIAISKSSSQSSVVDPITHSNVTSQSSATEAVIHPKAQAANVGPITISKASSQSSVIDPVTHSNVTSQSSTTEAVIHPKSSSQTSDAEPLTISKASSQASVIDPITHSKVSSQSSAAVNENQNQPILNSELHSSLPSAFLQRKTLSPEQVTDSKSGFQQPPQVPPKDFFPDRNLTYNTKEPSRFSQSSRRGFPSSFEPISPSDFPNGQINGAISESHATSFSNPRMPSPSFLSSNKRLNNNKRFPTIRPMSGSLRESRRFGPLDKTRFGPPVADYESETFSQNPMNNRQQVEPFDEDGYPSSASYPDHGPRRPEIEPPFSEPEYDEYDQEFRNPLPRPNFNYDELISQDSEKVGDRLQYDRRGPDIIEKEPYFKERLSRRLVNYIPNRKSSAFPPPEIEQQEHSNPLFHTLESHMTLPLEEPSSSPMPNDSFLFEPNYQNNIRENSPSSREWEVSTPPSMQQGNRKPEPESQLVSDLTRPSNNPGEDHVSCCNDYNRRAPLQCPFNPILKGNMTAPSYYILISRLPVDENGDEQYKVEKVYLGDGTPLICSFSPEATFSTSSYTPVPIAVAGKVKFRNIA